MKTPHALRSIALVVGLLAAAGASQAQTANPEGAWPGAAQSLSAQPSTRTRAEVIAELVQARAEGTLPRPGETYYEPAPIGAKASALAQVPARGEATAAARNGERAAAGH